MPYISRVGSSGRDGPEYVSEKAQISHVYGFSDPHEFWPTFQSARISINRTYLENLSASSSSSFIHGQSPVNYLHHDSFSSRHVALIASWCETLLDNSYCADKGRCSRRSRYLPAIPLCCPSLAISSCRTPASFVLLRCNLGETS